MADARSDSRLQEQLLEQLMSFPAGDVNNIETMLGQFIKLPRSSLATWSGQPHLVMAAQFTCYLKGHGMLEEELTSDASNPAFFTMMNALTLSPAKTREG